MVKKSYAKDCRKAAQARVLEFLARLESTEQTREAIKAVCDEEKEELEEKFSNLNTRACYMTDYRKAVKAWEQDIDLNDQNSNEIQTEAGVIRQHIALTHLNYTQSMHRQRKAPTEARKQEQRRHLTPITRIDEYLATVHRLLSSTDWRELSVGICAATGRRIGEVLKSGEFEQTAAYEVSFTGQLKQTKEEKQGGEERRYTIYTLTSSDLIVDAMERLRRLPEIKALKRKSMKEIDRITNSTINNHVRSELGEIVPPPHGEVALSSKNLRAAYANIAVYLFCPVNHSISAFITDRLGHTSDATASNYEDYQVCGNNGQPLTRGVWLERVGAAAAMPQESIEQARLYLTKAAKAAINDQDFLPYADQASRINELIRLAQIGKAWEEGKLTPEPVRTSSEPVQAAAEPVPNQFRTSSEPVQAASEEEEEETLPADSKPDYKAMSLEELKKYTRTPGVAYYKIRKAIQMIREYNDLVMQTMGTEHAYAINSRSIQDLSGCNSTSIKRYMASDEGKLNIESYNALHGFGVHHNRGKRPISEMIQH
jgi:hypothetical protein